MSVFSDWLNCLGVLSSDGVLIAVVLRVLACGNLLLRRAAAGLVWGLMIGAWLLPFLFIKRFVIKSLSIKTFIIHEFAINKLTINHSGSLAAQIVSWVVER